MPCAKIARAIYRLDVHFGALQPRSSNKCFTLYYFLLYLVFMLSTYISSSLTQLTIYNLFLRAIYKEFEVYTAFGGHLEALCKFESNGGKFSLVSRTAKSMSTIQVCQVPQAKTTLKVAWTYYQPFKEQQD